MSYTYFIIKLFLCKMKKFIRIAISCDQSFEEKYILHYRLVMYFPSLMEFNLDLIITYYELNKKRMLDRECDGY